jgi:uncharacterized protein with PCYCGC motif
MFKGLKKITVLVAAAVVVVGIGYGGYVYSHEPSHESSHEETTPGVVRVADPAEQLRVTLDPKNFQGDVRQAYEAAERNPALLAQLHCYCGCDKADGHKNLLDCFRDSHGSTCAICVGEARDAETMANRGVPVEQIRDALRARYAHGS